MLRSYRQGRRIGLYPRFHQKEGRAETCADTTCQGAGEQSGGCEHGIWVPADGAVEDPAEGVVEA
jgi:hypothetical protein